MAEYIEREAALTQLRKRTKDPNYWHCGEDWRNGLSLAFDVVDEIPAANVVEAVRCRYCIHRDKKGVCEKFRQRYPFFPEDDFYCGFGAKMDGKGESE